MPVSVPTLSASHFAARNKLGREVRFPDDSQIGTQHILGTYPARISADFQDIKGARHLTWSRGLKDRFGIGDLADDVVAEQTAETELPLEGGEARPRENSQFPPGAPVRRHLEGDCAPAANRDRLGCRPPIGMEWHHGPAGKPWHRPDCGGIPIASAAALSKSATQRPSAA